MIITFSLKVYLYILAMFDVALSQIPGIDYLYTAAQYFPDAVSNLFGFFHTILPSSFAIFSYFMVVVISIYIYRKVFIIIIESLIFTYAFGKIKGAFK